MFLDDVKIVCFVNNSQFFVYVRAWFLLYLIEHSEDLRQAKDV